MFMVNLYFGFTYELELFHSPFDFYDFFWSDFYPNLCVDKDNWWHERFLRTWGYTLQQRLNNFRL